MRRTDRQITEKSSIEEIINEAKVCRIGFSQENRPYILPMNFGYENNTVYIHSAKEGTKLDILKQNNEVCFEIDVKAELVERETACSYTMKYYSVIGFGKAYIIENEEEKKKAFDVIMKKYTGKTGFEYNSNALSSTVTIKIELTEISGKKAGY